RWRDLRVLIFTEYDDTKRYLREQLSAALVHTDRADQRIKVFTDRDRRHLKSVRKSSRRSTPRRKRMLFAFLSRPTQRVKVSTSRHIAGTSFTSTCRGTHPGWSNAMDASTASSSHETRGTAITSTITSSRRTASCRCSSARLRRTA